MKTLHFITWLLIIIGALNWLLVGVFGWDVGMLFGGQAALISRIIYILVGVSAIYEIFTHKSTCKMCSMSSMPAGGMMK
jgi:uncharacterized membrane protein YuzA (DUF378 family)